MVWLQLQVDAWREAVEEQPHRDDEAVVHEDGDQITPIHVAIYEYRYRTCLFIRLLINKPATSCTTVITYPRYEASDDSMYEYYNTRIHTHSDFVFDIYIYVTNCVSVSHDNTGVQQTLTGPHAGRRWRW